jgi:hypothetical protein
VANWLVSGGACPGQSPDTNISTHPHETHFFDNQDLYQLGSKFYSKLFQHCEQRNDTQILLDATPETIFHPQRVYNIYSQVPGGLDKALKFIVIVREPMSQQYYLYNQLPPEDKSTMSFDEYAEKVLKPNIVTSRNSPSKSDMPVDLLPSWTKYFGRDQLLVLSYDELEYSRLLFMWRTEKFLNKKMGRNLITDETGDELARRVPKKASEILDVYYWGKNMELYHWLNGKHAPTMERVPIYDFELAKSKELVLPNVLLLGAQFSGVTLVSLCFYCLCCLLFFFCYAEQKHTIQQNIDCRLVATQQCMWSRNL